MRRVIDAAPLLAVALGEPSQSAVAALLFQWSVAGDELHAPALIRYELANGLTRAASGARLAATSIAAIWQALAEFPLVVHELDQTEGRRAVEIALLLERKSVYDAAYIALAERLEAELWTLDGPLYRNASTHGLPVRLFG